MPAGLPTEEEKTGVEPEEETDSGLADEFDWEKQFRKDAVSQLEKWAENFGVSKFALDSFVRDNIDAATRFIWDRHQSRIGVGGIEGGQRHTERISTSEFQRMWEDGMIFFSRQSGLNFDGLTPSRGPSSGRRAPTAADLRNMFDEDQLTEQVNRMWGAYLVEDAPNPRAIAKSYIDTIVATGGEKELDFSTFVLNKIRSTNRHRAVYRNKPEGTDELSYITPYTQAAQTVIGGAGRPGAAANDVAAGGAALGASSAAFSDRLARTPEHQQTKGFINSLEERVRGVKNVLRG